MRRRDQVGHQRRDADAQVDHIAGPQGPQRAPGDGHALVLDPLAACVAAGRAAQVCQRGVRLDEVVHETAGGVDVVGLERTQRHDLLDLGDDQIGRGGHQRVEVALGHAVAQVAGRVGLPGAHQRHVGPQRGDVDEFLAVDDLCFRALGQHRAG